MSVHQTGCPLFEWSPFSARDTGFPADNIELRKLGWLLTEHRLHWLKAGYKLHYEGVRMLHPQHKDQPTWFRSISGADKQIFDWTVKAASLTESLRKAFEAQNPEVFVQGLLLLDTLFITQLNTLQCRIKALRSPAKTKIQLHNTAFFQIGDNICMNIRQ
ncbi:hypothetical protein [Bufonid herpesvirus 1]|uniref:hypothetical protein n=1 Tax=Bufonid herpesvirus 1 TaxID=2282206 RepID=UPI000EB63400|nr:hypothetical protein [Bufonid herpesvirus 1]AXF48530.1 hypothetical protein [Bufonid herpesvirus 1]